MLGSAQVRACFAEKTVVCGKGFFAAPRRFCREHRAPCWFLGKMLRSAGSRFRSTGAPKMPGNSSNQGHYTPPAVVKCKFPLSELRGEATYYTHRAVAGSRFPSTMPLIFRIKIFPKKSLTSNSRDMRSMLKTQAKTCMLLCYCNMFLQSTECRLLSTSILFQGRGFAVSELLSLSFPV